jgi:RNA polymerase sigma-70 factor, ECF subfamily
VIYGRVLKITAAVRACVCRRRKHKIEPIAAGCRDLHSGNQVATASMSAPLNEQSLLDAAISGDQSALEQLLWKNYEVLEQFVANRIPARARKHFGVEDILQTVFAEAFRDIRKFRSGTIAAFLAWLRTIADHRIIDALRKLERGGIHQISAGAWCSDQSVRNVIEIISSEDDSPSEVAAGKEAIQAIRIAIAGLPEDQEDVLRRHFLENQSIEEVAAATGRTAAAVRGLVHRGKKKLADVLGRSSRWFSKR